METVYLELEGTASLFLLSDIMTKKTGAVLAPSPPHTPSLEALDLLCLTCLPDKPSVSSYNSLCKFVFVFFFTV